SPRPQAAWDASTALVHFRPQGGRQLDDQKRICLMSLQIPPWTSFHGLLTGRVGCHGRFSRTSALARMTSFRMTAVRATLGFLPIARKRSPALAFAGALGLALLAVSP